MNTTLALVEQVILQQVERHEQRRARGARGEVDEWPAGPLPLSVLVRRTAGYYTRREIRAAVDSLTEDGRVRLLASKGEVCLELGTP